MRRPVSSKTSRLAQSSMVSANSRCPPGQDQDPRPCELFRRPRRIFPSLTTTTATPTAGRFMGSYSCNMVEFMVRTVVTRQVSWHVLIRGVVGIMVTGPKVLQEGGAEG